MFLCGEDFDTGVFSPFACCTPAVYIDENHDGHAGEKSSYRVFKGLREMNPTNHAANMEHAKKPIRSFISSGRLDKTRIHEVVHRTGELSVSSVRQDKEENRL